MKNRALTLLAGLAVLSAIALVLPGLVSKVGAQEAQAISVADTQAAIRDFNATCAGCHGENAGGGDRAPALADNPHLRVLDAEGIANIIRSGQRAMPPFPN